MKFLKRWWDQDRFRDWRNNPSDPARSQGTRGATAIEYGLIAALIAVAAITAMQGFGTSDSVGSDTSATSPCG